MVPFPLFLLGSKTWFFFQYSLWGPGRILGGKIYECVDSMRWLFFFSIRYEDLVEFLEVKFISVWTQPAWLCYYGIFNFQTCAYWTSSSSSIIVQVSPPLHWFPQRFQLVSVYQVNFISLHLSVSLSNLGGQWFDSKPLVSLVFWK